MSLSSLIFYPGCSRKSGRVNVCRMSTLGHSEIVFFFLSIGILLSTARIFGELASRLHQPAVLGEILAGIVLGPTVFGTFAPKLFHTIFPTDGALAVARHGLLSLSVVLFLLAAGLEVELSTIFRQGRTAFAVSTAGMVVPFAVGFAGAWFFQDDLGMAINSDPFIFSLFFATALSISALPVIAKTLMDLRLLRTDMGMIVIASAIVNDLMGWMIFAVLLAMMGSATSSPVPIAVTLVAIILYTVGMLSVGKWLIHRSLPWLQARTTWPGGVLSFSLALALFGAAFTEWVGVHAIFGSFLVGVAIGDSSHLRERTRSMLGQFISFFFAPLFFAGIGLRVNFLANFDLVLTLFVLAVACFGKIVGCGLGARWSGMTKRESWAVGFGMNARGAMEIVLGLLALQAAIIDERMFVALVIMALVTSMLSGPCMQRILGMKRKVEFVDFASSKLFVSPMRSETRYQAIQELCELVGVVQGFDTQQITERVWGRERVMAAGVSRGLAVPHARLDTITTPIVAIGIAPSGIDFDPSDGEPANVVILLLSPMEDDGLHFSLLSDIATTLESPKLRSRVLSAKSFTEFLAVIRTES